MPDSLKTDKRGSTLRWTVAAAVMLFVLVADQTIKVAVKTGFSLHESLEVTSWFHILFTENDGMAFGMDFIGTTLLTLFRVVAITLFMWVLAKAIARKVPVGLVVCLALIIAGAAGNIIDNCLYGLIFTESGDFLPPARFTTFGEGYGDFLNGRVVDMFYFPLFTWPDAMPLVGGKVFFGAIFNFADAAISCGAVALVLFYYRYLSSLSDPSDDKEKAGPDTTSTPQE